LFWQAALITLGTTPFILGVDCEHFGKPYSVTDTTSSFRGKLAEEYIKQSLQFVTEDEPSGEQNSFLLPFFAIFVVLLLGFLMTGKGGE